MFKIKRKSTGEILRVLDVYFDPTYHYIYFLVWENDAWCWHEARYYIQPNYEIKEKEKKDD